MDKIFILACFAFFSIYASEKNTPNFIIIYLDDMGYSDVGEFKNKKINTPNIDSASCGSGNVLKAAKYQKNNCKSKFERY